MVNNNNDNLLNAQKGSGVARDNIVYKQESIQEELLSSIQISHNDFDVKKWMDTFSNFSNKYKKLLYSKISSNIVSCENNETIENLANNLSNVVETIKPKEKNTRKDTRFVFVKADCYALFLKFYDHCNLAITQRGVYLKTEQEFKKISSETKFEVKEALNNATKEINKHVKQSKKKINNVEKNITTQLISLVSIFTALSFVIFGGISVLDNLLQNVKTLPIMKILLIGDLWFICMYNIFLLFIKFICLMTKRNFNCKWHPLILNSILLVILAIILFFGKNIYGTIFFL